MIKKYISVLMAAVCFFSAAGCSKSGSDKEESETVSSPETEISEIKEESVGELITPDEDSEEYSLGSYRLSGNGIKLYYEDDEISSGNMLALEKYFKAFADRDFETYKTCLYSGYADEMETYLQRDFGYGLEDSFSLQCDNLEEMAGGEYIITRIRAERSPEDGVQNFFQVLNDSFGRDYYSEVAENCDGFDDLYFSIISEAEGAESLIISEFEIVFAENDGKYYTFG